MLIAILLLIISFTTTATSISGDIQLELTHIDHGRNLTKFELLSRAAHRSRARASLLNSMKCTSDPLSRANVPFRPSGAGEYVLELAIGTPPSPYPFLLDTGSGLIWTQCKPCSTKHCIKQPSPIFDPSKSSTFSHLSCSDKLCQVLYQKNCTRNHCEYYYSYADQTYSYGDFASEMFTLGTSSKVKVQMAMGCGHQNGGDLNNSSGIAGFSRDATSIISQLGVTGFSYCMTDDINKRTLLKFGTQEEIFRGIKGPVQSTKFIKVKDSPPQYDGLYFVSMTGITVGNKRLSIPKSVFAQGAMVDSGTAFTDLPDVAYDELKKAFLSSTKLSPSNTSILGLECFASPSIRLSQVKVPKVIFHFPGMDLDFPRDNYVEVFDDDGVMCLLMTKSGSSSGIIGNAQQMNMQVLYDLKNNKLVIAPNQCDKK